MQQTEKYKLNLIESSDPFLPEGLNQNTQKLEDAMAAHEAKVDGQIAVTDAKVDAIAQRVGTGGHTCRIAWGKFNCPVTSVSSPAKLTFDFCPVYAIFANADSLGHSAGPAVFVRDIPQSRAPDNYQDTWRVTWGEKSISWYHDYFYNPARAISFTYIVFGYDPNS